MLMIRFFSRLREAAGAGEYAVHLPADVSSVDDLRRHLRGLDPRFDVALADTRGLRIAVNRAMAEPDAPVHDGDEVAFFPPVTGG
jgi:molybdopterin synthase sulfur carrier subunit